LANVAAAEGLGQPAPSMPPMRLLAPPLQLVPLVLLAPGQRPGPMQQPAPAAIESPLPAAIHASPLPEELQPGDRRMQADWSSARVSRIACRP
jgi:hypothetical protein